MDKPLDVFGFSSYRDYLTSWIEEARRKKQGNLTRLAAQIGVHSSYLAHVLTGAKNLSVEQAAELSEIMKHTNLERDFFFALVQLDRAGTVKLRRYWSEKISAIHQERAKIKSRVGDHHELSAEDRAVYYSSWIYGAIYVATDIDGGQTLLQIAERFHLRPEQAAEVLTFLVRIGACNFKDSLYMMGKPVIYLTNDSPLIVKHHTNWRVRAMNKMDSREASELFYTSPMSMSRNDFVRVRELLAKTIQSSLEICRTSPAEEVVCLSIDFFRSTT